MGDVKERPILFSAPMVRAILDGRKTQTRRVMKPQPVSVERWFRGAPTTDTSAEHAVPRDASGKGWIGPCGPFKSQYGVAGDRLWVREEHYRFGHWEQKEKASKKTGRVGYRFVADSTETRFEAPVDARVSPPRTDDERERSQWYKRLARFMPRTSSRTLLEVVSVRVEQLHDITEEDAKAEGADRDFSVVDDDREDPREVGYSLASDVARHEATAHRRFFCSLWESINGADSWMANPWVWVVEFRRVTT